MNLDLTNISNIPTGPDALHLILLVLSLVLFIALLTKKGQVIEKTIEKQIPVEVEKVVEVIKEVTIEKIVEVPAIVQAADPAAACQLLALLQSEARFIDFIQEEISGATDDQIGAAARIIHAGSQKVVNEYFSLSPIRSEEEESQVTITEGFNPAEVKLIGHVVGQAPFRGILTHQGWKITETKLPKLAKEHDTRIIAAAEVEL